MKYKLIQVLTTYNKGEGKCKENVNGSRWSLVEFEDNMLEGISTRDNRDKNIENAEAVGEVKMTFCIIVLMS